MKPIETNYGGYRFRSRLEARWAVFFDAMGIEWEYEPQGYLLENGSTYLPDFYLPYFNVYAEVKGGEWLSDGDASRLKQFALERDWVAKHTRKSREIAVLVLGNIPRRSRQVFLTAAADNWLECYFGTEGGNLTLFTEGAIWPLDDIARYCEEWEPGMGRYRINRGVGTSHWRKAPLGIDRAYSKARKARFEHGETPVFA